MCVPRIAVFVCIEFASVSHIVNANFLVQPKKINSSWWSWLIDWFKGLVVFCYKQLLHLSHQMSLYSLRGTTRRLAARLRQFWLQTCDNNRLTCDKTILQLPTKQDIVACGGHTGARPRASSRKISWFWAEIDLCNAIAEWCVFMCYAHGKVHVWSRVVSSSLQSGWEEVISPLRLSHWKHFFHYFIMSVWVTQL